MNLYRSFGNLMEAWMTESAPGGQDWLEERVEDEPPSPPSDVDTNVRSESVDSGVETASSDSSFPASSLDAFTPERQETPMSPSPVLSMPAHASSSSSSSPYLMPNQRSKVEQALSRIESMSEKRPGSMVEEVVRRRPLSSLLPKRHTSELLRGQRSGSFSRRTSPSPSLLVRQMSDVHRRPHSAIYVRQTSETIPEVFFGEEKSELSPGLQYLEQVCQMLEEYAKDQLHFIAQEEAVEDIQEEQATGTCQHASVEQEVRSRQFVDKAQAERSSSEPTQRREHFYGHFRQRSLSDTNLASLHLRRVKLDYRDHNLSFHDLMETAEEDQENQESQKEGLNKSKSFWRFKFGSLRRDSAMKSQQMLPSEKSTTRRRLSQLFRRRRKTGPV